MQQRLNRSNITVSKCLLGLALLLSLQHFKDHFVLPVLSLLLYIFIVHTILIIALQVWIDF